MHLSVIIPVYLSHDTLPDCIAGLQRQDFQNFEVIFVDSSPDERSAAIIRKYPSFQLVRSTQRLWMFAARNVGVSHARGAIFAFTDPDCIPAPDWLSELDESFQQGHRAVGGPVGCASEQYFEQLAHVVKFSRWLPGSPSGFISDQPTANFAVDQELFISLGGFSEQFFAADSLFCSQLLQNGYRIYYNPEATVEHLHAGTTLRPFLRERFQRGVDFAQMRSTLSEWNSAKSVIFLAMFWLLPLRHLFWKLVQSARRGFLGTTLVLIPLILLCDYAWMFGQAKAFWRQLWGLPPLKIMT